MASRTHRNAHRQHDAREQAEDHIMEAQQKQDDDASSAASQPTEVVIEIRDSNDQGPHHTVYKTLSADFKGPIARYVTVRAEPSSGLIVDDGSEEEESSTTLKTKKKSPETDENGMPTAIEAPQSTKININSIIKETEASTSTTALHDANISDITKSIASATASSTSDSSKDDGAAAGPGAGVIAGIVFGVLGGLLMIGLLVFFCISKKKKNAQQQQIADDEKSDMGAGAAATRTQSYSEAHPNAPRLSLRPVTQFFANGFTAGEKRNSRGAAMALTPTAAAAKRTPANRQSIQSINAPHARPGTSNSVHSINPFSDSQVARGTPAAVNPFGNQFAERAPSPVSDVESMYSKKPMPPSPMSANAPVDPFTANGPSKMGRKSSTRQNAPRELDLTVPNHRGPPSPTGTDYSERPETPGTGPVASAGAAAIAAAGGPVNTSVHRVQLDFSATLEDEMNLKAGELVRLLHEYDDGWALCIRLDRSRQGVVPRTCLSTRPVKPRAPANGQRPGPPVNPQRPGPPVSMNAQSRARAVSNASTAGRPISPRPVSPMSQTSRPGTAARPVSPGGVSTHTTKGAHGPSPMSQHQRLPSDHGAPGQAY